MKNYAQVLEFPAIQAKLEHHCISHLAKEKAVNLTAFTHMQALQEELQMTEEAMTLDRLLGRLPMSEVDDISLSLKKAEMDGTLTCEELYDIYYVLDNAASLIDYFHSYEGEIVYMRDLVEGIETDRSLMQDIVRCIEPDMHVSDHASDALYTIRRQMISLEQRIRHTMESYLKDFKDDLSLDNLAMRNDRLVLGVKATRKASVKGLVHATSASGSTVFVEPERVVYMNNELSELKSAELEEITRILHRLTRRVKGDVMILRYNQDILSELDFLFAKAALGNEYDSVIPIITSKGDLILKQSRHPLIEKKKVVANDIILDTKIMLITGSNTGGKTVAIKTAGLLSYMALCGMSVPCTEARIPFFDEIFVDVGDEQSIIQSLSTFSSHMERIKTILEQVTERSLVLIDEIGSGTDPSEGSALAQAIIDALLKKGCMAIASTHYGALKTYAASHPLMSVAAVGFDMEQMRPTYKLKLHTAGSSYALEIASSLGLDPQIIADAKRYREESITAEERLMEELKNREIQLEQNEKDLEALMVQNKKDAERLNKRLARIDDEKERILEVARIEANKTLEEAKSMIDLLAEELRSQAVLKDHHVTAAKHALDELKVEKKVEEKVQTHQLAVGDHIRIDAMNREGDIVEIGKNHAITVAMGGLNIKLKDHEVTYLHGKMKEKKTKARTSAKKQKTGHYEINIIGMRYNEAMETVDKFLDDALYLGYPSVRIIHGMGTGALRNGVRKMLDRKSFVKSYSNGGPNEGGLGATIVQFE